MKKRILTAVAFAGLFCSVARGGEAAYTADWASLDSRPLPAWYDDAKFGVFIHWGVYSVPAWSPRGSYAEWYWHGLRTGATEAYGLTAFRKYAKKSSALSEIQKFHYKNYGKEFAYQDFAPLFRAELFDPDQWAELFRRAGARYVVLTSKHHDGFCLWPAPNSRDWNSVNSGPKRDLAGDLTQAVKRAGLRMGFYYSLYEWYNRTYLEDAPRYVEERMIPHLRDLVQRYEPSILWGDGEWDYPSDLWRTREFMAWLYDESSVRDDVVVNDRWGQEVRSSHGGFFTSEYGQGAAGKTVDRSRKWEENRGMGGSYGYNRNERLEDYRTATQMIHQFIDIVSEGGNLLLNVGPDSDGRIPVIMQERLLEMGAWLDLNGDAIYGTRRWKVASDGDDVRYTMKNGSVYAIVKRWPGKNLVLHHVAPGKETAVRLLGRDGELKWSYAGDRLSIEMPDLAADEIPGRHAYAFEITGAAGI